MMFLARTKKGSQNVPSKSHSTTKGFFSLSPLGKFSQRPVRKLGAPEETFCSHRVQVVMSCFIACGTHTFRLPPLHSLHYNCILPLFTTLCPHYTTTTYMSSSLPFFLLVLFPGSASCMGTMSSNFIGKSKGTEPLLFVSFCPHSLCS